MITLDPDELDRLAASIDRHAAAVRARAARLAAASAHVRWTSTAADAFRTRAGDLAAGLRHGADHLESAAHTLRRHARTVRIVQDALRVAQSVAAASVHGVEDAVLAGARTASGAARVVHAVGRYL